VGGRASGGGGVRGVDGSGRASVAAGKGKSDGGLSQMEELRFQQLRAKKERLSFAIGRLELEAGQRERQLRKSMAFAQ
jgi:DASH complex subunit SPC19